MNEAPDTPEMKAVAAFLAASFDSKMSGANMREAMIWSLGRAALAAQPGPVGEPYAYAVYFPDQPTEELVHDLDELLDDMTNREHTVTPLFVAAPTEAKPATQQAEGWVMVPVEPTPAMLVAMWDHRESMRGQSENRIARAGYAAMLAAAPTEAKPAQQDAVDAEAGALSPEQEEWVMDLAQKHNLGRRVGQIGTLQGVSPDVFYTDASYRTQELFDFAAELLASSELNADQRRALVGNWFAEDWAIHQALGLLDDYDTDRAAISAKKGG